MESVLFLLPFSHYNTRSKMVWSIPVLMERCNCLCQAPIPGNTPYGRKYIIQLDLAVALCTPAWSQLWLTKCKRRVPRCAPFYDYHQPWPSFSSIVPFHSMRCYKGLDTEGSAKSCKLLATNMQRSTWRATQVSSHTKARLRPKRNSRHICELGRFAPTQQPLPSDAITKPLPLQPSHRHPHALHPLRAPPLPSHLTSLPHLCMSKSPKPP